MPSVRCRFPLRRASLALCALSALPPAARAEVSWLPAPSAMPRSLSDPGQPRFAIAYLPDPERVDAAIGAPFPLAAVSAGVIRLTCALEGGANLTLGRDGSTFPLQTVDGRFGLALDGVRGPWVSRLRLVHVSAHKADGDSTVAYPGFTYSRELASLDLGWLRRGAFVYAGMGAAWHAVPRDRGIHLAAGGEVRTARGCWRPLASLHLAGDRERKWRVAKSLFLGVETGRDLRVRLGVRAFDGPSPRGQSRLSGERYAGVEFQLAPRSLQL